jgi:hypothetical protein
LIGIQTQVASLVTSTTSVKEQLRKNTAAIQSNGTTILEQVKESQGVVKQLLQPKPFKIIEKKRKRDPNCDEVIESDNWQKRMKSKQDFVGCMIPTPKTSPFELQAKLDKIFMDFRLDVPLRLAAFNTLKSIPRHGFYCVEGWMGGDRKAVEGESRCAYCKSEGETCLQAQVPEGGEGCLYVRLMK